MRVTRFAVAILVLISSGCIYAEDAPPCSTAEHHAFDFWVGDWQVHTPDGKLAGYNHVTREYAGCVIHEHYTTTRGYGGESLNVYDATRKVWHQTWVDSDGTLLVLEGGLQAGNMRLMGTLIDKGKSVKQRITWTPNAGSVRQLWEATDDKGKWTVVFDGLYTHDNRK